MRISDWSSDVCSSDLVQKSGNGWRARCPGCAGRSRKLSVGVSDDGRILLHCFGGCEAAVVVQAAGLTIADLFPERLAADTPEERRRRQRLARERSEEHTSELQSLMRISYAVFCLKKKNH